MRPPQSLRRPAARVPARSNPVAAGPLSIVQAVPLAVQAPNHWLPPPATPSVPGGPPGLTQFRLPSDFANTLFDFQIAAVKIAAHHLNKRRGVLIGDVVGLGKTLMATAVARIFEDDHDLETLIICPKNLVPMWQDYHDKYRLRGRVLSISRAIKELPKLRRYRLVLIDESHNLRNREGKRYRAIQEYIKENESRVILLTATPYNKTYIDLSNQLRLFVAEDADIGIRPENLLRELTEIEFKRSHQCFVRSLAAFEKSPYADDWRELMRLYLVRRTRSFIQANYADTDPANGRKFLTFADGSRSYFPTRCPKTVKFKIDDNDPNDQYARLYSTPVVDAINTLRLPRYGLGNYVHERPDTPPTAAEGKIIGDLSRAGRRLMGFCRTNLFKRLESSGQAFIQSVERHILRNYIYLHALENKLAVPIGTQDASALDARFTDSDKGQTVTVDCLDQGQEVVFAVHNPAVIPEEVQLQIFQRSFSTKGQPGRGVGTYSMKLLGEQYLGGKVNFVSRPPQGTTFTLALPKARRRQRP